MTSETQQDHEILVEVQRRRAELRLAMVELERALASASRAGDPARGADSWSGRVRAALSGLHDAFGRHVGITEGPDGLYAELALYSPRLAHNIDRLGAEHAEITRRLEELRAWTDVDDERPDAAEIRRAGTDLLVLLMRHRQRGADLIFEAYQLDIGGET
jgi:hypothetical protein